VCWHRPVIGTLAAYALERVRTTDAFKFNVNLVIVQTWLGATNYLDDPTTYKAIKESLTDLQSPAATVLLYGNDRGAARTYALEALDRQATAPWFIVEVAVAGKAQTTTDPFYKAMTNKQLGATPLANSRWITFCGMRDTNPDSGCTGMRATTDWIKTMGGRVELSIEDPAGGANGFMENPSYVQISLNLFTSLLPKQ